MAQHIPTKAFNQKAFRVIEVGVESAFRKSRGLMKSSFVYEYIGDQEGLEVYLTTRNIPKGLVHGTDKGTIEVHYNKEKGRVEHIYLVA